MTEAETARWHESPCIRCSRCVDNCPLHLSPTKIAHAVKFRDLEMANKYDMSACCECGCTIADAERGKCAWIGGMFICARCKARVEDMANPRAAKKPR